MAFGLFVLSTLLFQALRVVGQDDSPPPLIPTAVIPPGVAALNSKIPSLEAAYQRDVFFVGGRYEYNETLRGSIVVDQIYVEKLTPSTGVSHPNPLILFHGGGSGGTLWLNTPDNRKGWATYFLEQGYMVYIIDQTSVGRSTSNDLNGYPLAAVFTAEGAERGFTGMERFDDYPQAKLHNQWPGDGKMGDPTFEAFLANFVPLTTNRTRQQTSMRDSGCALLNQTGPAFLLSHSIGAVLTTVIADKCPELVLGNIGIEPSNFPFFSYPIISGPPGGPSRPYGLADIPLAYDPPITNLGNDLIVTKVGIDKPERAACWRQEQEPIRQLANLRQVPNLVVTGEASQHATVDHCIVEYYNQTGCPVDWINLPEIGIRGNGHFLFLEKNNGDIVRVVSDWILKVEESLAD